MSTISELELANQSLREAVETRIAVAEAACCEGMPLCRAVDTRGPLVDPDVLEADEDELLEPQCVAAMDGAALEQAWAAVKARHDEVIGRLAGEPARTVREQRVYGKDGELAGAGEEGVTPAEALLRAAIDTTAARRAVYGPPTKHFSITVGLLNAAFSARIAERVAAGQPPFTLTDWPIIMLLDKVAREMGPGHNSDTAVDLCGYSATLAECKAC